MNLRDAAEAAINTLEYAADVSDRPGLMGMCEKAAELLRTALAEAEDPPRREPLTEEQITTLANSIRWSDNYHYDFVRAIERAHRIGGDE